MQITLTLKMTTAQVVETSVTGNSNSPIQDYVHPDDQTQPTFEITPGFKPFTADLLLERQNIQSATILIKTFVTLCLSYMNHLKLIPQTHFRHLFNGVEVKEKP